MMKSVKIEAEGKNRPAVTDLKPFVLAILRDPVPLREAAPPKPPPDDDGEWEVKIKLDPDREGTDGKSYSGEKSYVSELTDRGATLVIEYKDREHPENPPRQGLVRMTWSEPPKIITPKKPVTIQLNVRLEAPPGTGMWVEDMPELYAQRDDHNPLLFHQLSLKESGRGSPNFTLWTQDMLGGGRVYEVQHPGTLLYKFELSGFWTLVDNYHAKTYYPDTFGLVVGSSRRAYALFEYRRKR